jgi:hypothetical protein
MIDNIVINKTFVLNYQASGRRIGSDHHQGHPASNFFNIQVGTGFNTNTIGHDFYRNPGGKLDWLGFDDGSRAYQPACH